jgi:hypothetical protein
MLLAIWLKGASEDGEACWTNPMIGFGSRLPRHCGTTRTAVPCLVGGAKMPISRGTALGEISEITLRHGVTLAQGHFRCDTEELIDMLTNWRRNAAG